MENSQNFSAVRWMWIQIWNNNALCKSIRLRDPFSWTKYVLSMKSHWKSANIHLIPKLHKHGIPGCPVVSSCGCITGNISIIVDWSLEPLISSVPTYIRDTQGNRKRLKDEVYLLYSSLERALKRRRVPNITDVVRITWEWLLCLKWSAGLSAGGEF